MKRLLSIALNITGIAFLSGCTSVPGATEDLARYRDIDPNQNHMFAISGLRYAGLRDAALSVGARAGLASRAKQINKEVLSYTLTLDRIFNFNHLLDDHHVLPPVLMEGRNQLIQNHDEQIRVSDRVYTIVAQAKFVTAAPNWRDYLILNYSTPEMPDASLYPKNDNEKQVWDRYIEEGWRAGMMQADAIILENIGRLKRDYSGMILYKTLLVQGMVTEPYVAKVDFGITGSENEMAINDRIYRITAKPIFNQQSSNWKTEIASK